MSTDNNKPKRRLTFYHFLLWLLVGIQFSAHVLNHITPEADRTGVSLVNAWIGIGTCFSDNWSAFTVITILGCVGVYLYKHLMNEKFTLQDALSYLVAVLANVFFFLKAWDVNAWTEKWTAINNAPIPFMVWTAVIVGITVAVHAFIKSRQAYAEFDKQVLPSLDELGEGDKLREQSQAEIEYMTKHPRMYRYQMEQLHKSQRKNIENEILLQQQEFQKKQNEQELQIAYARLETNRKINDEKQAERLEKAREADDEKEIEKILKEIQGKIEINTTKEETNTGLIATIVSFFLSVLLVIFWVKVNNTDKEQMFNELLFDTKFVGQWLTKLDEPLQTLITLISVPVLFVVLIVLIYLSIYTSVRIMLNMLVSYSKDSRQIDRIATLIKKFFFDTFDGIMRPLFLIPDFLEVVEDLLLGTNLDDKANEYNKEDD